MLPPFDSDRPKPVGLRGNRSPPAVRRLGSGFSGRTIQTGGSLTQRESLSLPATENDLQARMSPSMRLGKSGNGPVVLPSALQGYSRCSNDGVLAGILLAPSNPLPHLLGAFEVLGEELMPAGKFDVFSDAFSAFLCAQGFGRGV